VPDTQLSLAIGKKGQNARLAAKLTGMRIDIKSESEVEAERSPRDASASADRAALAALPVGAVVSEALVAAGLGSPAAIVKAGRERLAAIPEVGDEVDAIYLAAEKWVASHGVPEGVSAADDDVRPDAPPQTSSSA
jgi:N utilization substance protein A